MTPRNSESTEVIHVSSLSGLPAAAQSLARYDLLTLLSPGHAETDWSTFTPGRHLALSFHDIAEPVPDLIAPEPDMIRAIIAFGRETPQSQPLLIHCWAGISRSSAAAYIIACDRNPGHERAIAAELRRRAPFATPNLLMIALADAMLGRDGAMISAIATIGRGADAFEGSAYQLPLVFPLAPLP